MFVTAPDHDVGRKLATRILEGKHAACVNIIPSVESHYWWNGTIESSNEVLLLIKTTKDHAAALEKLVLELHPYETPEFVGMAIDFGNKKYLEWISESLRPATTQTLANEDSY